MEAQRRDETERVLKTDYAAVRRLYDVPFIDYDKPMTGEKYLDEAKAEAKGILVSLMKRRIEEVNLREVIKDPRTIYREKEALIEKLKSLKIIQNMNERQLEDIF